MTLLELDTSLFHAFNHLPHGPLWNTLASFAHVLTYGGAMYYPIALAFLFSKRPKLILIAKLGLLSGFSTWIVTEVIKNIVGRLRPYQTLHDIIFISPPPTGYSFPSGQAATAFMIATVFLLVLKRRHQWVTAGVFAWAMGIGIDRMYMGHHYFFDVIAGALVGAAVGWFIYFLAVSSRGESSVQNINVDSLSK